MADPAKLKKAIARHAALLKDIVSRFPPAEHDAIMAALAAAAVGPAIRNAANPHRMYAGIGHTADTALAMALMAKTKAPAG